MFVFFVFWFIGIDVFCWYDFYICFVFCIFFSCWKLFGISSYGDYLYILLIIILYIFGIIYGGFWDVIDVIFCRICWMIFIGCYYFLLNILFIIISVIYVERSIFLIYISCGMILNIWIYFVVCVWKFFEIIMVWLRIVDNIFRIVLLIRWRICINIILFCIYKLFFKWNGGIWLVINIVWIIMWDLVWWLEKIRFILIVILVYGVIDRRVGILDII